jgi:predicted DNA-binding transcriptional regulator AlpA
MAETNAIQFLTDAQLCEMLHVDDRTTLRWRNAGGGPPFVRVGPRRILYRWVDVEAWISAHTYPHRASEAAAPELRGGRLS